MHNKTKALILASALVGATWRTTIVHSQPNEAADAASANVTVESTPAPESTTSVGTRATVTGSGTLGKIPKWNGASILGDSIISQANGKIGIGTSTPDQILTVTGGNIFIATPDRGLKFPDNSVQKTAALVFGVQAGTGLKASSTTGVVKLSVRVPLILSGTTDSVIIQGTNNGTGAGIFGKTASADYAGVTGQNTGAGDGLTGFGASGYGVAGVSTSGVGTGGFSTSSNGVFGQTAATNRSAVLGNNTGGGRGVEGMSTSSDGVGGFSKTGNGVVGRTEGGSTAAGVLGATTGSNGIGVAGRSDTGINAVGVYGSSTAGYGVTGQSSGANTSGVFGRHTAAGAGVSGQSATGYGVTGQTGGGASVAGVVGKHTANGPGVAGQSATGYGVSGQTGGGSTTAGVYGKSTGADGIGVFGEAMNGPDATAVYGRVNNGSGVLGSAGVGRGVEGSSASGVGVFGETGGTAAAVAGSNLSSGPGVYGESDGGPGVEGESHSGGVDNAGVVGTNSSSGPGASGVSASGIGVRGQSTSSYAGAFLGNVMITGDLTAGSINSSSKNFKIDHPLDPEHKYLYHASIESSDLMNLYNGNAVLDGKGEATVQLPEWFGALNTDFRYQLTAIGAPGPNLYIAQKINNNRFKIAGGQPGSEVSWQVTGIRQDAWAKTHPMAVEMLKPAREQGSYLYPEAFGQPASKSVLAVAHPEMMESLPPAPTLPLAPQPVLPEP